MKLPRFGRKTLVTMVTNQLKATASSQGSRQESKSDARFNSSRRAMRLSIIGNYPLSKPRLKRRHPLLLVQTKLPPTMLGMRSGGEIACVAVVAWDYTTIIIVTFEFLLKGIDKQELRYRISEY
jgi:hypothetical protein